MYIYHKEYIQLRIPLSQEKLDMSFRISETAVLKDNQFPVLYPSLSVLGFGLGGKIN